MKVGIFTFPNSISYGATLQMYALCRTVSEFGHEVEAINYFNAFMRNEEHCRPAGLSKCIYATKRMLRRVLYANQYWKFRAFERNHITLYPRKAFSSKAFLSRLGDRYGAVICGSDQVWNPNITDSDLSYFLDFCGETTRRISYAPSFGVEKLSTELAFAATKELEKFHALSVREVQGKAMILDMIGREVPVVLDPTMLVGAEDWTKLESPYRVKREYLLYFTVKSSPRLFKKARDFAAEQNLRMIVVGGGMIRRIKNRDPVVQYAINVSPKEWLWLVDHARYVVTNSFHGTAFSIIFEKDFYLELSSATNSRLSHIVNMLELQDRIISSEQEIIPKQADYTIAREELARLREASLDYLKDALSEDTNHG